MAAPDGPGDGISAGSQLVAEAVGEPSLRLDPADPDPAATLIARVQQLSPSKRKALKPALGSVCIELLRTSNMLLHSGMIAASSRFIALALAFYAVYLAVEE